MPSCRNDVSQFKKKKKTVFDNEINFVGLEEQQDVGREEDDQAGQAEDLLGQPMPESEG